MIQSIAHVTHVSGVYTLASKVTIDGSSADPVAYGVDATYLSLSDLNVTAGTVINPEKSDELLVNSSLLQAIGVKDPASAIGKQATVLLTLSDGSTFEKHTRIVGIVNSGSGSEVFLSEKTFQEASVPTFAEAKALVDDKAFVPDARHAIESLGYQTSSPVDTIDQINQVFHLFNLILIGLGSVGMIIAVLGMLNTLTVSLLERTKEIALMIALGARPKDMQRLFTAEAVILSLTGGIIGMLLATGVGRVTDLILNGFAKGRGVAEGFSLFAVSPLLIVGTLIFMVVIGVGVSFIPARHASRINAVEALRQE